MLLIRGKSMKASGIEEIKNVVMDLDLPREDTILFGLVCPYCGKNDRVRPLEPPDELEGQLEKSDLEIYQGLWNNLRRGGEKSAGLAVCKFCRNVMRINSNFTAVEAIF